MGDNGTGRIARARATASRYWVAAKRRYPALAHVTTAWKRFNERNGGQYAAAITYFSFLALFPLVLLAVSVAAFVLHSHPAALQSLFDSITKQLPGSFGSTVHNAIETAIARRASIGIVGLVGVLLTGLGWIGNLRAAVDACWGRRPPQRNFVMAKVANLGVLCGLGLAVLVSIGLTAAGTSLAQLLIRHAGAENLTGAHYLLTAVGIVLAIAGDMLVLFWLLVMLPGAKPPRSVALLGVVVGAVGFEILQLAGTYIITRSSHSPTAGPLAGIVAILIWIQLVARLILFCAAWMAVLTEAARVSAAAEALPAPVLTGSPAPATTDERPAVSPAAVAGTLFGAGAATGAALFAWAGRGRRRAPRS